MVMIEFFLEGELREEFVVIYLLVFLFSFYSIVIGDRGR